MQDFNAEEMNKN